MNPDEEIAAVVTQLEHLVVQLRSNVTDLRAILVTDPEVPGDRAPA